MANNFSLSANAAICDPATGRITPEFYRYLLSLNKTADEAGAGEIVTAPGSGLTGGGAVADGVTLALANQGVGDAQLRYGAGTSVIGRAAGSTGQVADIVAANDERVLSREGGTLAFRPYLNGISLGPTSPAPVRCTTLRIDTAPVAGVPVATHTVEVNLNGSLYKLLATT